MPNEDRLIWIDLETFGLNTRTDFIIEVGFKITDLKLREIDEFSCLVWQPSLHDQRYDDCQANPMDKYVYDMHTKSGLFADASKKGKTFLEAESRMNTWLDYYEVSGGVEPLCGSSVHFDRGMLEEQFPSVFSRFHYRIIDNSSLKELCRKYAPDLYKKNVDARKIHRVIPDLEDTIQEFAFYRDNFLKIP